eukprot:CAMPEP_0119406652 /NCGR_PEP_ID=MMETSP1335-20130426/897_1 /TAXON_ID=259385 /ORGANISM="Chrysoculter rhomboideus, Strain RCC1486" /LENGTH=44 /DNA_ID= /DNA_START= /DNA_END= /DNA_ORIENTATION=
MDNVARDVLEEDPTHPCWLDRTTSARTHSQRLTPRPASGPVPLV